MIQIVIVLYKTTLDKSLSFNSLRKYADKLTVPHNILIVNNYPDIHIADDNDYKVLTPENNVMLSGAYNLALDEAKANGHQWIMLLDQDTLITEEYINEINRVFTEGVQDDIASVVPIVRQATNNIQISPATYNPFWGLVNITMLSKGVYNNCVSAINSCAVVRVNAIEQIGGFPKNYPLDGLDVIYFYYLYKNDWKCMVIEPVIYQNLSVYDFKNSMNMTRYKSILKSESDLAKDMGGMAVVTTKLRYCVRVLKQLINKDKREYAFTTFKSIFSK